MYLEIITPERTVYEGETQSVTLPGTKGRFQVLKDHAPVISSLDNGPVQLNTEQGEESYPIEGGVAEVLNNRILVLAEGAHVDEKS